MQIPRFSKTTFLGGFLFIIGRIFFIYLLFFLCLFLLVDKREFSARLKYRPLDEAISFRDLMVFARQPGATPGETQLRLSAYLAYFNKIKIMYPEDVGADIFLGDL